MLIAMYLVIRIAPFSSNAGDMVSLPAFDLLESSLEAEQHSFQVPEMLKTMSLMQYHIGS